ncbi:MAG: ATP-binding cassette domain-containing protein [Anaerolineae bacterium]|nr:ATP-binding cassette domain-containing protein [Anaerolineae bacterium]
MTASTLTRLVAVQNLRKSFGPKLAVADVSFEVRPGEVFGLLGPNGAGKTTTIRMILDIFQPDAGTVEVLGGALTPARKDRIGYMPEERGLYPTMRVLECLVYLGTLKGLTRSQARQAAESYLERLELADQRQAKIETLSRGMTQKVQVIAAVLHNPDLLIIDEPFANLDPINTQLIREIILELRAQGKAIIMTSHQLALVEALCDRIAMIHNGRVVLQGTVAEVRRQFASNILLLSGSGEVGSLPGVTEVERRSPTEWQLTLASEANPQAVLHALTANGHFTVDRFEVGLPTLDQIFVQVVRDKGRDI